MAKGDDLAPSAPPHPSAPPSYEDAMWGGGGAALAPVVTNQLQAAAPLYPQQPGYAPPSGYYPVGPPPGTHLAMPPHPPVPVVNVPLPIGPKPLRCECPSCHAQITSKTIARGKCLPHICCFLLFLSGICCCFSCLPYCFCPPERTEHFCPKCNAFLGTYVCK